MAWFFLKKFITDISLMIKSFNRDSYSAGKLIKRERRKEKMDEQRIRKQRVTIKKITKGKRKVKKQEGGEEKEEKETW